MKQLFSIGTIVAVLFCCLQLNAQTGSQCFESPTKPDIANAHIEWVVDGQTVTIRTTFAKTFVDNTYGTNAVGWSNGHTFSNLVGSDNLQLALYDASGAKKLEFKQDYITSSSGAPSGYDCLGVMGGEGQMIVGSSSSIVSATSSLDQNLNTFGYVLTANSPATSSSYDANLSYPNWIYDVYYEVTVNLSAFGSAGFGYPAIAAVHASPSKTGNNTEVVIPTDCPNTLELNVSGNCVQDCSESINLTVNSINSPFIYTWSNGATTEDISGLCAGAYSVTVTTADGTTLTASASVTDGTCPGDEQCFVSPTIPDIANAHSSWSISGNILTIRTTFAKTFVDNTYGTNAIGWSNGHSFSNLVGSDHIQLALYDANGVKKLEFKQDYITASSGAPSGYDCLGVIDGEGQMILGDESSVLSATTSLDQNMNTFGYVLTANSPATNSSYTPNATYPSWIYEVWYEANIDLSVFGSAGFGYPRIASVHASPSKTGNNTEIVNPDDCPVDCSNSTLAVSGQVRPDLQCDTIAPPQDCNCSCEGEGLKTITVMFVGTSGSDVNVYASSGQQDLVASFTNVQFGDILFVDGTSLPGGKLFNKTFFKVVGGKETKIYTNCKKEIKGNTYDAFKVLGFMDALGNVCDAEANCDQCPCYKYFKQLSLMYNGASGAGISVYEDASHTKLIASFSNVQDGNIITLERPGKNLPKIIYITINGGAHLMLTSECNKIAVGATYGAFTLVGFIDKKGRECSFTNPCDGDGSINLAVTGGVLPYMFEWSDGSSSEDLSDLCSGTFSVTVTDSLGCTATSTFNVGTAPCALVAIGDFVWHDLNANGQQDAGEPGISGVTVQLYDADNDSLLATIATDANGYYLFDSLDLGNYYIIFGHASVPNGLLPSLSDVGNDDTDSDADAITGKTGIYALNPGDTILTVDAGYRCGSCDDNNPCTLDNCVNGHCNYSPIPNCPCELAITGFTLVHVGFGGDIDSLTDGYVIDRDTLCTFNIRADVCGDVVKSVKFMLNGNLFRVEERVPFAVAGDNPLGDYHTWQPAPGTYIIEAIPYDGPNATGNAGTSMTITIIIVDGPGINSTCICDDNNLCTIDEFVNEDCSNTPVEIEIESTLNHVSCFSASDGSIDITVTGGTLPYSFSWSNGFNSEDISGLIADTYTVTVTEKNGCSKLQTMIITQPSELVLGVVSSPATCDNNDGEIALSVTGSVPSYTFLWSNDATTQSISGLSTGYYTVTVTDSHGCQSTVSTVVVGPANCDPCANVNCDDNNECTIDSCANGQCSHVQIPGCPCSLEITGFTLVYPGFLGDIDSMMDGYVIDRDTLCTFNIRADVCGDVVKSVKFMLNGNLFRVEESVPFAVAGDNPQGDYHAWMPAPGTYTIIAIPYDGQNATGNAGSSMTITITVVDGPGINTTCICDDHNFCTIDEYVYQECSHTPIVCADNDACTSNNCENGICVFPSIICDDNNACTTDACMAGGCEYTPIVCSDKNDCTTDACVAGNCEYTAIICDDNDACTTDACLAGDCEYTAIICDDNDACTTDACVSGVCEYTANICDDSDACTTDACVAGNCEYTAIICDDNDACTTDACLAGNCDYTAIVCNDNDACTTDECESGTCEYTAIICNDNDACTTDACANGACEYTAIVCDDNDACTTDTCVSGVCEYTANICDDSDACTTDACVAGNCDYTAITCDDNDACTTDACLAGNCDYTAIICDDNDACTTDACLAENCDYTAITCDDNDACTTDACLAGVCEYTAITCDDNDVCTTDACVAGNCVYTAIVCNDNDACTTDECLNGQCTFILIPNCPNPCRLEITRFALVHEGTLGDIVSLTDGMVINRDTLCRFNIRAEVCEDTAESVKFIVNGSPFRTENTVPYAIAGDNPTGNYHPWLPNGGTYTITAIPYSADGASGTAGVPLSITITIVGAADACTNICNDNNLCTIDENLNGQCVFTEINCSDNNSCTIDACDNGVCTHEGMVCDDDDLCTTDGCSTGECLFTSIVCNDNNACTTDECVIGQCVFTPIIIEIMHENTDVTDTCGGQGNQLCLLDFAGLPHGTILTGEEYAAYGIHISWSAYPNTWTNTPNINQLIIFNTFATGTWDHDLQASIGNIAIFPENLTDNDFNGLVDMPNDTRWGGQQIYSFDFDKTVLSVTIVDHDKAGGSIKAYDQFNNLIISVPIPTLGDGEVAVVPVNATRVRRLVIDDNDSGGTSNISFACETSCCNATAEISVDGGTAPYTYHWSTGDTTAFVDALCEGTYYVTVVDANGCSQVEVVVIGVEQQFQFRMVENEYDNYIAYPVPFNDLLSVEYTAKEAGKVVIALYNTMGQIVYQTEMMADKGVNRASLSPGNVTLDGMYFLELRKNDYSENIKVSKYH